MFLEAKSDPKSDPYGTQAGKKRDFSMIRLSNLTDRFSAAGSLLLAALPLLAMGALAH